MVRKAVILALMGGALLLAVAGAPAEAAPPGLCRLSGTSPGGQEVHAHAGSPNIQGIMDAWTAAGFTDITFDCH